MHRDGQPIALKDTPEETNLGWILEDDDLIFSIQHRENSCLTTEVIGVADSGSLSVQGSQQIAPELFEVQALFVPAGPGVVRMNFELNEVGGGNLKQGTITLHVKALYDLTVNLGTGTEGDPDTDGTFVEGEELSYTYSTETCYDNLIVTVNGAVATADGVIIMDSHQNVVTSASLVQNTVDVESVSGGSTDHDGQTTVDCDGSLTITPSPDPCFIFSSWAGDATGQDNPLVLNNIMSDLNITPVFTTRTLPINGTTASGGVIDIGCVTPIPCGASCAIEAVPDPCYEFTGWGGDLEGLDNPIVVSDITESLDFSANFSLLSYNIQVVSSSGGTTDAEGANLVSCGGTLNITATPDPGFTFVGWSGDASGNDNPILLEDIQQDLNITATFTPNDHVVEVFSTAGGSTDQDGSQTITPGGDLTIAATAESCYEFVGWSGDVGGSTNPLILTGIDQDMEITANFTRQIQIVQVSSTSGGFTDKEGNNVVNCNDDLVITASPDLGFTFLGWSGDVTGNDNPVVIVDVIENINVTAHFSSPDPEPPVLDAHDELTNSSIVTISGSATSVDVEVSAPSGVITVPVTDGLFAADIALLPNRRNTIFFTGVNGSQRSAPTATTITHDSSPPTLAILFPEDGATLTTETTDVAGAVGDLLSGFSGLAVTINGVQAIVDIGIGTNGSFFAEAVPLNVGESTLIEVTGVDILGNIITRQITLYHEEIPANEPMMEASAGNGQTGQIQELLEDPIQVLITDGNGTPFSNKIVTFEVIRSDGLLSLDQVSEGVRVLQIRTDTDGLAQAYWRLGMDAGCGNNRVSVASTSIGGTVFFCASADPAPVAQVNVGSGNNQRVEVNAPACEPLIIWVNDSCNGVMDVPVTFRAVNGGGLVNGMSEITVDSSDTGHAQINYTMGPAPGVQTIEADFPGNPGSPVVFSLQGVTRDIGRPTSFSGLVIDNAGRPVEGAICSLSVSGQTVPDSVSDANGIFSFTSIPDGPGELHVDGMAATGLNGEVISVGSFPALHYNVVIVPNASNSLPSPVKLPRLNLNNAVSFDNTTDVVLTVEEIDGLEMKIKAGSMTLVDGTVPGPGNPALLSLNPVHIDDIPMPMPDGAAPPFAWTLQPGGATFDPPIEISYPNMSSLAPGALAFFLSFNHDTNDFEIVATGSVTEDGATIQTDPGMGLTMAGWGGVCPPYPVTGGACFGNPSRCASSGSLSGGTVSASSANAVCGETLTFTVTGVTDTGGIKIEGCAGQEQSVPISPNSITYRFELLKPDGTIHMGQNNVTSIIANDIGSYSCRFYASADRECLKETKLVGTATVNVNPASLDLNSELIFEGNLAEGQLISSQVWNSSRQIDLNSFIIDSGLSTVEWTVNGIISSSAVLYLGADPGDLNIRTYNVRVRSLNCSVLDEEFVLVVYSRDTLNIFRNWVANESQDLEWIEDLPGSYLTLGEDNSDPEPDCEPQMWEGLDEESNHYHPGMVFEMRSEPVNGHGNQATYDNDGVLITTPPGAGTVDRSAPFILRHRGDDVYPYVRAAQIDGNPVETVFFGADLDGPLLHYGRSLKDYISVRPVKVTPALMAGTCPPEDLSPKTSPNEIQYSIISNSDLAFSISSHDKSDNQYVIRLGNYQYPLIFEISKGHMIESFIIKDYLRLLERVGSVDFDRLSSSFSNPRFVAAIRFNVKESSLPKAFSGTDVGYLSVDGEFVIPTSIIKLYEKSFIFLEETKIFQEVTSFLNDINNLPKYITSSELYEFYSWSCAKESNRSKARSPLRHKFNPELFLNPANGSYLRFRSFLDFHFLDNEFIFNIEVINKDRNIHYDVPAMYINGSWKVCLWN